MQQNPDRPLTPSTPAHQSMHSDVNETGPARERTISPLAIGLLGAAAIAASLLFVRQQNRDAPPASTSPASGSVAVSLDRLRELGI